MKIILFIGTVIMTMANACAEPTKIDISAIRDFELIQQQGMSVQRLADDYLAKDTGGLAILLPRFKNVAAINSAYKAKRADYEHALNVCVPALPEAGKKLRQLQKTFQKRVGFSVADVPVYAVFGADNTAATTSPTGIVLGLESLCQQASTHTEAEAVVINYVTHEWVHALQYQLTTRTSFKFTLLEMALLEGSADYIAGVVLGDEFTLDDQRQHYGQHHSDELWQQFASQMQSYDYAPWLYTPKTDTPADMGYWMGSQIARGYLNNTHDFRGLLQLTDAKDILDKSGIVHIENKM